MTTFYLIKDEHGYYVSTSDKHKIGTYTDISIRRTNRNDLSVFKGDHIWGSFSDSVNAKKYAIELAENAKD